MDFTASICVQPLNATWSSLTKTDCLKYRGELVGKACEFVPDVTLMSFILFFGTYTCSMALKKFKTSPFFPTTVSDPTNPSQTRTGPISVEQVRILTASGLKMKSGLGSSVQVRKLISDFAIILAILIFCGVDMLVGVETPKLIVPSEFKVSPQSSERVH